MPTSNILYKYQIGANTEPINYAKSVPTTDGINSTEAALKKWILVSQKYMWGHLCHSYVL